MPATQPKPDQAGAEAASGEEQKQALLRLIERAEGFTLVFVRSNSPLLAATFLGDLAQELPRLGKRLQRLSLQEKIEDLLEVLLALPREEGRILAVTGLEYSIGVESDGAEQAGVLHRMNLRRSRFLELDCPLLIFVPDFVAGLFGREAPDFWSFKSAYFDLGEDHIDPWTLKMSADRWGYGGLDADAKQRELEHLQSLMSGAEPKRQIEIVSRQSFLLQKMGRLGEALRLLKEEALPICKKLHDEHGQTLVLMLMVQIERKLGHLQKARNLYEKQLRPRLKHADARLRWQSELSHASILLELGQVQAARRLLQKEVLPAIESGGWWPEVVMARMAMANILVKTGEHLAVEKYIKAHLDPIASEIYKAQMGPAYEALKIGMARSQGRLSEAIERIESRVLPQLEQRGEIFDLIRVQMELADLLLARQLPGDQKRAIELIEQAATAAHELGLPLAADWQKTLEELRRLA